MARKLNKSVTSERLTLSAWVYFGICILAVVNAFLDARWLVLVTVGLTLLYIALQFRNIPVKQRFAGMALFIVGAIAAYISGTFQETLIDGIARSRIFLLLFFAVAWLQVPVGKSPSLESARDAIMNQPPGRRFLGLSIGVHILGALLNVAAVGLLSPLLKDRSDEVLHRRLSVAIMHGFSSASAWSPFYIGMIVVLVAIPTITWAEIMVQGMAMAVVMILGAWLFDRLRYPRQKTAEPEQLKAAGPPLNIAKIVLLLLSLIGSVTLTLEFMDVSIPVALGLACPPFGLIWYITQRERATGIGRPLASMTHHVISGLPGLRNEALMFVAANVFGIGIASIIPTDDLSAQLDMVLPWLDARILAIIVIFLFCGFIGLHPVIVVLSLGVILSPEIIGLRDWVLGLVYLGCWGLTTMISPYSGTTLFMSRFTGVPPHVIGWKWVPYSVCFNAGLMAIFIIILRHLTL
jgi:hypothetical protein